MDLIKKRSETISAIKDYIVANKGIIEQEYKITIDSRICGDIKESTMLAWLQVYASRILMAKGVNECKEFKDIIIDFISLNRDTEASIYLSK